MSVAVVMAGVLVLVGGLVDHRGLGGAELQPIAHFDHCPAVIQIFGMIETRFRRALEWPIQRLSTLLISTATLLLAGCSILFGDVSLTIDGKQQHISGSVSCSAHSGGDVVEVGKLPGGISVVLAPDEPRIEALELGNSTGKSLVGRNTKVSRQNGKYDITGEAVPKDTNDSSAPKPFELKVECR